jgi:hypothetical protein
MGLALTIPQILRPDWTVIARYKQSNTSLFGLFIINEGKLFYNIDTWMLSICSSTSFVDMRPRKMAATVKYLP